MKMKEKEGTHERQNAGKDSLPQTRARRGRARARPRTWVLPRPHRARARQTRKRFISVRSTCVHLDNN
jgi:hypothetical protein